MPHKQAEINFSNLKQLADTPELKEILKKIENETVSQVRDVWLEHFFEKVFCPKCKQNLNHFDNRIWCEKCGFKTNY
jgi:predicted amidophosphoribosyltransferase